MTWSGGGKGSGICSGEPGRFQSPNTGPTYPPPAGLQSSPADPVKLPCTLKCIARHAIGSLVGLLLLLHQEVDPAECH